MSGVDLTTNLPLFARIQGSYKDVAPSLQTGFSPVPIEEENVLQITAVNCHKHLISPWIPKTLK